MPVMTDTGSGRPTYNRFIYKLVLLGGLTAGSASSAAQTELPDRCAYAYAAAGNRMGLMVAEMINNLGAEENLRLAFQAVSLSNALQCPAEPMNSTVDCTIRLVRSNGGAKPDVVDVVKCVESATGSAFPKTVN